MKFDGNARAKMLGVIGERDVHPRRQVKTKRNRFDPSRPERDRCFFVMWGFSMWQLENIDGFTNKCAETPCSIFSSIVIVTMKGVSFRLLIP